MPHSGGGGSHGGGSHGGSHGGSGSSNRVSKTYFRGARRYMYYYNGRPHFYYANRKDVTNPKLSGAVLIVFAVIWTLMVLPVVIGSISTLFDTGSLTLNYDTRIVIDDELGIVDNKAELTEAFKEFQKKTGVTFSVVTRSPENEYMGSSYETQAFNCYVSRWDDERHWLIYYVGSSLDRSDDWHWELMCGDDCTRILSSSIEAQFTKDFHRYLVASGRYTFNEAVLTALNNVNVKPGSIKVGDIILILLVLVFPAFGIVFLVSGIKMVIKPITAKEKAKNTAVEINVNADCQEVVCDYCGGVYIRHTCIECPHCAAPVKVDNTN